MMPIPGGVFPADDNPERRSAVAMAMAKFVSEIIPTILGLREAIATMRTKEPEVGFVKGEAVWALDTLMAQLNRRVIEADRRAV